MVNSMSAVGKAIRDTHQWVAPEILRSFFFATPEATALTRLLKDNFDIIYIHQRLRSPTTNMLDLGVWETVVENHTFISEWSG